MPSVRISPGRLTALWTVIRALDKLGAEAPVQEVRRVASRTSLRSGGLPVGDGLTLALEGGFIEQRGQTLSLAPLGREALRIETEDEPGPALRRLFMSVLLLRDPPTWVAFWQGDPAALDLVIPEPERRLLEEAGLYPEADPTSLEKNAWWAALKRVPLPDETSAFRRIIGDAGEQLTVEYERTRLCREGFDELAAAVRWVAQESPAYGFDVLSFHGATYGGDPVAQVAIEVKSTARPAPQVFPFYLTAHEWYTAVSVGGDYVLHLWDGVDPVGPRARTAAPLKVPAAELAGHVPAPPTCGADCAWETASVRLPLAMLRGGTT